MSFKQNLLRKMTLERTAREVIASIGSPDGDRRLDRDAMRRLLAMSPCTHRRERDLDLYLFEDEGDGPRVLVLDNGLALYRTPPEDVALRKSPTVKEMLNLRNIIKILNDADVVVSKREDSVRAVLAAALDQLDLTFTDDDIEGLRREGQLALETADTAGVQECLALFADLLGYTPPPRSVGVENLQALGRPAGDAKAPARFGPLVLYRPADQGLLLLEEPLDLDQTAQREQLKQVALGQAPATLEGAAVLERLKHTVLERGAG
jgi:hypothetical protein